MLPPLATIPISSSTCLGLDGSAITLGNVAAYNADQFSQISSAGGRLVVIAACQPDDHKATSERVAECGFLVHAVRFLPSIAEVNCLCPYQEELGWYRSYLWHKTLIADKEGVTHYVDYDPQTLDLFRRFLPNVECHYMWELCERDDTVHVSQSTHPPLNVSDTAPIKTEYPPYNPKIVYAGAQGIIKGVTCDFTTDPPTYTIG
jgi:hypothetical protein